MQTTRATVVFTQSIAPKVTAKSVPYRSHSSNPIFLYFHGCDFGRNGFAMFEFTITGMSAIERSVFIGFRRVKKSNLPNKSLEPSRLRPTFFARNVLFRCAVSGWLTAGVRQGGDNCV